MWECSKVDSSCWVEVTSLSVLADVLDLEIPIATDNVLSAIAALLDEEDGWWRTTSELESRLPKDGFGYQILNTRFFFNVTEAKRVSGDLVLVAAAYLQTQNLPLSGALGVLRNLKNNLKMLTEDELEVVRVIIGKAGNVNPYSVGVPEARVRDAYVDASVDIDRLLDSLERKKVVEKVRVGKIRLVR